MIADRLTSAIVPMGYPSSAEFRNRLAEVLAERDEAILDAYVDDETIPYARLHDGIAAQTKRAVVHPVFFGSAITGAGVDALMSGIAELLLPADEGDADAAPASGTVFKIDAAQQASGSRTSGCSRARCGCETVCRSATTSAK